MKITTNAVKEIGLIPMHDMKLNTLYQIIDYDNMHNGSFIVRCCRDSVMDLTKPSTWNNASKNPTKVRLLPKGFKITLTQE